MPSKVDNGSFKDVRENVDGNPMMSMLQYLRPYWSWLLVGTIASFAMYFAQLVPSITVAAAIDRVIATSGEPGLLAQVGLMPTESVPASATDQRLQLLYQLAAIAAGAYATLAVVRYTALYVFHKLAQHVQHDLRMDTYDHLQTLSLGFYHNHHTGSMMSVLNNDVNRLEAFFNVELREIFRAIVMVGAVGAVMYTISPELAFIALVPMPIIAVLTAKFMQWLTPQYKLIREKVATMNTALSNNLGGIEVIKSFDRYDVEMNRMTDQSSDYRDSKVRALKYRQLFFASIRVVIGGIFVVILWQGGKNVIAGTMTMGTFALFFMLLKRLDGPMERIGKTANKWQKTKASAERVFGILNIEPEVRSPDDPYVPEEVTGRVTVDDIEFGYDDAEGKVFDGLSVDVEPGETIGLVGTSGAGKSTLMKLVPRFYDVSSGSIEIDGTDVREWDVRSLRNSIGIVEQSPYLFGGTIRENIAYGDRHAYVSVASGASGDDVETRVVEAAKAAGAHKFITDLPDGYETQVGERGVKLSGGQRQRISIARTLLNDPEIIVFDEATSSVDTTTEEIIQENINRLSADRTAFIIAHRLSTVQDADRILVLDDGEIIEEGTHEELWAAAGTYASLWAAQANVGAQSSEAGA